MFDHYIYTRLYTYIIGLVVDGHGNPDHSISSALYNEFYLTSAVAILGTAKPCKYTLIYDNIGFRMAEVQLLSYWLCYAYCRCNRSVSYPAPAYYAHWAAKRAKVLVAAGATPEELVAVSEEWGGSISNMFFV